MRGLKAQLKHAGRWAQGSVGTNVVFEEGNGSHSQLLSLDCGTAGVFTLKGARSGPQEVFRDDLTGQVLPTELVRAARRKELEYFESKGVWKLVPLGQARSEAGRPPISVRWVDANKGDDINPNIRSRLVAREIRGHNEAAIFAPTPPLEALRTVLSLAVTQLPGEGPKDRRPNSEDRVQVSLVDISRAYFNSPTGEKV